VADYDKLLPGVCGKLEVILGWALGAKACIHACVQRRAFMCSVCMHVHAGWSHFAQFTIAVVNKDPKKSKYSGEHLHSVLVAFQQGVKSVSKQQF